MVKAGMAIAEGVNEEYIPTDVNTINIIFAKVIDDILVPGDTTNIRLFFR